VQSGTANPVLKTGGNVPDDSKTRQYALHAGEIQNPNVEIRKDDLRFGFRILDFGFTILP
jgi:hypothetical protein